MRATKWHISNTLQRPRLESCTQKSSKVLTQHLGWCLLPVSWMVRQSASGMMPTQHEKNHPRSRILFCVAKKKRDYSCPRLLITDIKACNNNDWSKSSKKCCSSTTALILPYVRSPNHKYRMHLELQVQIWSSLVKLLASRFVIIERKEDHNDDDCKDFQGCQSHNMSKERTSTPRT